jgi:FkbM family methyltransferase
VEQWGSSRAVSASVMEDIEPIRAEERCIFQSHRRGNFSAKTNHKLPMFPRVLIPQVPSFTRRTCSSIAPPMKHDSASIPATPSRPIAIGSRFCLALLVFACAAVLFFYSQYNDGAEVLTQVHLRSSVLLPDSEPVTTLPPLVSPVSRASDSSKVVDADPELSKAQVAEIRDHCRGWYTSLRKQHFTVHRFLNFQAGVEPIAAASVMAEMNALCKDIRASLGSASTLNGSAVVVDIGANDGGDVGFWFRLFGVDGKSACAPMTKFYLVEPQAKYQEVLQTLASRNRPSRGSDVRVVHAAVGRDGQHGTTVTIIGTNQQSVVNLDNRENVRVDRGRVVQETASVTVVSLKRLISEDGIAPHVPILLLKVDCEGADATILMDSRELFAERRVEMLVMELNGKQRHFRMRHKHVAIMLERYGYALFLFGRDESYSKLRYMQLTAAMFATWPASLETLVAFSPRMMARLSTARGLFHKHRRAAPPTLLTMCSNGTIDVPCTLCDTRPK